MFHRRWVRRVGLGLIALLVLGVIGFFGHRYRTAETGAKRYAAVTARLDETDPGWRDPAGEAIPDDQNSALLVARVKAALAGGKFDVKRADGKYIGSASTAPNRRPDDGDWAAIDRAFEGNAAALAIARSFKDYPRGRRSRPPGEALFTFTPRLTTDTRTAFSLLNEEAKRLGRDGRPGAAFELVRALLNAPRSIDGDVVLMDGLIRLAGDGITIWRVQCLLGQTNPRGGLAPVQAALAEEAESDFVWRSIRGERALLHRTFANIAAGRYPARSAVAVQLGTPAPAGLKEQARDRAEAPYLPAEHAGFLELTTQMCEAARLPAHRQRAAFRAITVPDWPPVLAAVGTEAFTQAERIFEAGLRIRAHLRCAVGGVAIERYLLRAGRWPATLAELPTDLLAEVPLDPFDGRPLRYVRRADGVTVYSIGPDGQDNGGEVGDNNGGGTKPGTDVCFRLYDPDQRGLPPLPPEPSPFDERPPPSDGPPILPYPREVGEEP